MCVAVLANGCNESQYRFELGDATQDGDVVIGRGAAKVLIDPVSLDLLAGAASKSGPHSGGATQPVRRASFSSGSGHPRRTAGTE